MRLGKGQIAAERCRDANADVGDSGTQRGGKPEPAADQRSWAMPEVRGRVADDDRATS